MDSQIFSKSGVAEKPDSVAWIKKCLLDSSICILDWAPGKKEEGTPRHHVMEAARRRNKGLFVEDQKALSRSFD